MESNLISEIAKELCRRFPNEKDPKDFSDDRLRVLILELPLSLWIHPEELFSLTLNEIWDKLNKELDSCTLDKIKDEWAREKEKEVNER